MPAPVVDVASSFSGGSTASLTWSHTCTGTGTDGILIVAAGFGETPPNTMSATYNAVAMTAVPSSYKDDGVFDGVQLFYMLVPPTGAHNVVVSYSPNPTGCAAGAVSYTGVNQSTPFGTAATASGSSAIASVSVTSAVGELVIGALASDSNNTITINGGTSRWEVESVGGDTSYSQGDFTGASSVTVRWDQLNTNWAITGVSLKPVSGGGAAAQVPYQPQYQMAPVMAQ
jgi:hypothetical protein